MKKGITPVIATILLLIITIAIVGYSFGFFQRLFGAAANVTSTGLDDLTKNIRQAITIDGVNGVTVVLRNGANPSINSTVLGFYVDGALIPCSFGSGVVSVMINSSSIIPCTLTTGCPSGGTLRVTTATFADSMTC